MAIPLGFARLQFLIDVARTQYLPGNDPNAELPYIVKLKLREDWWAMIEEALQALDERARCSQCEKVHYSPDNYVSLIPFLFTSAKHQEAHISRRG